MFLGGNTKPLKIVYYLHHTLLLLSLIAVNISKRMLGILQVVAVIFIVLLWKCVKMDKKVLSMSWAQHLIDFIDKINGSFDIRSVQLEA